MGAPAVVVDALDLLWRGFATREQRERMISYVPTEYNNVLVDDDGFLFVTTSAYEYWQYKEGNMHALRRLNAKGLDILSRIEDPSGDYNVPLTSGSFTGPSAIVDVCKIGYGDYAILDQKRGRVFAYNADGQLLYEFGGPGNFSGSLNVPTALDYYNGNYYVVDSNKSQIYRYRLTEYGKLFQEVSEARSTIDFQQEETLWNRIIGYNVNCDLANKGLGNAAYRKQDMKTAMVYYRLAGDQENYSKAYAFVRRAWIERNAVWLLVIAAGCTVAVILFAKIKKRVLAGQKTSDYLAALAYSGYIRFHPLDGFWDLKREKRGSMRAALTILFATCAVTVLTALFTGFIFNTYDLKTYNMLLEILKILLATVLWCASLWCVTSLLDGEGKLKDIVIATCYSMTPYIGLNLLGIVLSNFMLQNEGDFYGVVVTLGYLWLGFLLVFSVKQTHDYSLLKTFAVILITFVVILLIVFVAALLLALLQQLWAVVLDVYDEITLRL